MANRKCANAPAVTLGDSLPRRRFLQRCFAAGIAVGGAPAGKAFAAEPSPTSPIKRSVAAYSFRSYLPQNGRSGRITLHDFFELAAGWGLGAVEPTSYYFSSEDLDYLHSLKAKAFRLGLAISGTAVRNDFCHLDPEVRRRSIDHVNKWADMAVQLGAPVIRIFAGNEHRDVTEKQAFRWSVECMKECCDHAGKRGTFLAIENHGYLTGSSDDLLRILEAVDHEWLGINLDTGNFLKAPYENMAKAAPHALNVQLKTDVVSPDGAGRQEADFKRIVNILRGANYRGYVALEYEAEEDPYTGVPKYLDRLKAAIGT